MDAKRLIGACVVVLVTFGLRNAVAQAGGNDGTRTGLAKSHPDRSVFLKLYAERWRWWR